MLEVRDDPVLVEQAVLVGGVIISIFVRPDARSISIAKLFGSVICVAGCATVGFLDALGVV